MRGGEDVDDGAAGDEGGGFFRSDVVFEQTEGAGFPITLEIEIRAIFEQHVECVERLLDERHGATAERVRNGLIDCRTYVRVRFEQRTHVYGVAGAERGVELFERRLRQRVDFPPQVGPALEAVAARDRE